MRNIVLVSVLLLIPMISFADVVKNEKYYQEQHCKSVNGETEFVLDDRTRIDCLTDKVAIEYDWAKKWAECLGQALYYSAKKDVDAVCALIGNRREINKYGKRAKYTKKYHNLPLTIIFINK